MGVMQALAVQQNTRVGWNSVGWNSVAFSTINWCRLALKPGVFDFVALALVAKHCLGMPVKKLQLPVISLRSRSLSWMLACMWCLGERGVNVCNILVSRAIRPFNTELKFEYSMLCSVEFETESVLSWQVSCRNGQPDRLRPIHRQSMQTRLL